MTIEYYYTRQSTGFLDINNIGNCFIECFNDSGDSFLIWIKTVYGKTTILTQDFIEDDIEESNIQLKTIPYNFDKIKKFIYSFINTPQYKITQAMELDISEEEKISKFENLISIMNNIKTREDKKADI